MEFIKFIFSSFWRWAGFALLLLGILSGVAEIIKACKRNRKVTVCRIGSKWQVEIENATAGDVVSATLAKDPEEIMTLDEEADGE